MANRGVITARDIEGHTLYIKPLGSESPIPYRFDVPYTTAKGEKRNGCGYLIGKLNVGDTIEYSYGKDTYGVLYLKFAKKVDAGATPQSFNARSLSAPTQTMGDEEIVDLRQHIIIYQHCQKVAVDLVLADDRIEFHDRCDAAFNTAKIIYDDICRTFGIESKVKV
jgi:hypothetical protein